jgi:hypothetical protein
LTKIVEVYKFDRKGSDVPINIIFLSNSNVIEYLKCFDFSFCITYYDGDKIYYQPETLNKTGYILRMMDLTKGNNHFKFKIRCVKYIARGFTILAKDKHNKTTIEKVHSVYIDELFTRKKDQNRSSNDNFEAHYDQKTANLSISSMTLSDISLSDMKRKLHSKKPVSLSFYDTKINNYNLIYILDILTKACQDENKGFYLTFKDCKFTESGAYQIFVDYMSKIRLICLHISGTSFAGSDNINGKINKSMIYQQILKSDIQYICISQNNKISKSLTKLAYYNRKRIEHKTFDNQKIASDNISTIPKLLDNIIDYYQVPQMRVPACK